MKSWNDSLNQYGRATTLPNFQNDSIADDAANENTSILSYVQNLTGQGNAGSLNSTVQFGKVTLDGLLGRILVSDGTNQRLELGLDEATGLQKIKLSQTGFSVLSATSDQLIMSSDFDMFKIVLAGTASITGFDNSGGTTWHHSTVSVNHNLGYIPTAQVYFNLGSTFRIPIPGALSITSPSGGVDSFPYDLAARVLLYATKMDVFLDIAPGKDGSGTFDFKYYLMRETA